MPYRLFKIFLFLFAGLSACPIIWAQNQCPDNIDFERGNFTNWICRKGFSVATLSGTAPVVNQHDIVSSPNSNRDFYGNFPVLCPNGSNHSVKLGNALTRNQDNGTGAQEVSYTYAIPANVTNFSVLYQYAVVLQDPPGTSHTQTEKPRFQAIVKNITDNIDIGCVSFDFIAGSLPGFLPSPVATVGGQVYYKDWTPITLNLSQYAGKTIKLQFITSDCTLGGHFGYAYVDVNSSCNGAIVGTTMCQGDASVTLTAPYGFETYNWYADQAFSQVISTTQQLLLNPAPNAGAVYPVVVTPYSGYGCVDTLYATLTLAPKPNSNAGSDAAVCKWEQIPIGTAPYLNYTYAWSPASQVSDPSISNPTGFVSSFGPPTELVVTTTDLASGCYSTDTVILTPKSYDTSLTVNGKTDYCINEPLTTTININNSSTSIQWFNNTSPVAGANLPSFTPTSTGDYWAQYTQVGCTDTSRSIHFDAFPLPVASFSPDNDTQCVTKNSFIFTNNSTISDGTALSYLWRFGDGTTTTTAAPAKSFNYTGLIPVKLIANSIHNCKDSISQSMRVLPNITPDFNWDKACTNALTIFDNRTVENGSPAVSYAWDFGNTSSSILKYPAPFTYTNAGDYIVKLTVTALGCENDNRSISKNLKAFGIRNGITYPTLTVPAGYNTLIWAQFDSLGARYQWNPATQLNDSRIKAPYFFGITDVKYQITITDKNGCLTKDTLQMLVLKKQGWYLPNTFTPNGDGLNDVIRPYLIGMKSLTRFSIYNRIGNLVFNTVRDGEGWDGTYMGRKLDTGAFVWILEYMDDSNKPVQQKGSLLLLR